MITTPIGQRYQIELEPAANVSSAGLVMDNNNNASMAPVVGTIIKVGDNCRFAAGVKIFFRRFSLDEMKFITPDGEQVVNFLEEEDILGIITE